MFGTLHKLRKIGEGKGVASVTNWIKIENYRCVALTKS